MIIIPAAGRSIFRMPGYHDPESLRVMEVFLVPPVWQPGTVFEDVVLPTVFKGLQFVVTNPGMTSATEPVWPTLVGDTVEESTGIIYEAQTYQFLDPAVSILSVGTTISASDAVELDQKVIGTTKVGFRILALPVGVTSFKVTVHAALDNGAAPEIEILFRVRGAGC